MRLLLIAIFPHSCIWFLVCVYRALDSFLFILFGLNFSINLGILDYLNRKFSEVEIMRRSGKKELSPYYYLDLDNVDPKIDNKPPKVEIDTYYKPQSLQADAETVMEIDKQNMELVKKLNTIHRLGVSLKSLLLQ